MKEPANTELGLNQNSKESSRSEVSTGPKYLFLTVLILVFAGLVYFSINKFFQAATAVGGGSIAMIEKVGDKASEMAKSFSEGFKTTVEIENSSYTLKDKKITDLNFIQRKTLCITKFQTTWIKSTATVIIKGGYTIKAGYDMNEFSIERNDSEKTITVTMPPPKINSIQTDFQEIYYVDEGTLKKLEPEEIAEAYRRNQEQAKIEAKSLGLLDDVDEAMRERLKVIVGAYDYELIILKEVIIKKKD